MLGSPLVEIDRGREHDGFLRGRSGYARRERGVRERDGNQEMRRGRSNQKYHLSPSVTGMNHALSKNSLPTW